MKFSIVITTYNRLSLLKRAIDTALAQTMPCEVIVADDFSCDETQAYIHSLGDRVIYHRNSSNLGHSATMNAGVQIATGDWIKPVDDDDYLATNCIEEMARAIALRPSAVICSCQASQVDANEVEISVTRRTGPGKAFYIPQEDIHYGMLLELVPFGTPIQVAFRRDAFLKSGGWDCSLDTNFDDIDSWIRIAQFGDAIFINQCLAYRTLWQGAYNQKFSLQTRLDTNILIKQKIYDLVNEQHHPEIPTIENIQAYLKLHWSLVALKQKNIFSAFNMFLPVAFSPSAWKLLLGKASLEAEPHNSSQEQLYRNILLGKKRSISVSRVPRFTRLNFQYLRFNLRLRCSLLAFKQGKFLYALQLATSAVCSRNAWKLFATSVLSGNTDNNLPIQKQQSNARAIKRIYALVNQKEPSKLPYIQDLQTYFKLRWSLLAFKQGKIRSAVRMAFPAMLSPVAWKLLARITRLRRSQSKEPRIRKLVLIESENYSE